MKKLPVTHDELVRLMTYDLLTGACHWLIKPNGRVPAGSRLGWVDAKGYSLVKFRRTTVGLHRLIWFYVHGEWPTDFIDHIDGNPGNNAISNLRVLSNAENCQNKRKPPANNTSGFLGVSFERGRFKAYIGLNGKKRHIGMFPTAEAAYAAYLDAKRVLHPACTI